MKKIVLIGSALWAAPILAFAQGGSTLIGLIRLAGDVLSMLIPILIALTLVIFFWGLFLYVFKSGGSEAEKASARKIMIAGLLSLFVMVSIWGILRLLQDTLKVGSQAPIPPPQVYLPPR